LIAFTVIFLDRYEDIINKYRQFVTKNKDRYEQNYQGKYWRSTAFWAQVLSKNLLAFSDTQLVTGLAIQFTALVKHCDMTIYHFRIVTELAFLTTITHLLTVIALRNYFVKNKWINLPRIFFMLANLGLLGYTSFVSYSYDLVNSGSGSLDLSMSLACFYHSDRPGFRTAFGGKWAALLICAIGGHATIILAMYWLDEPSTAQPNRAWWYHVGAAIRTWVFAPAYSLYGIWMAGDGLQYTQALGHANVAIDGSERKWSFGQFLPVLLLALPVFAGWESFWEEKDDDRDNRFGRPSARLSRNILARSGSDVDADAQKDSPRGGRSRSLDPSVEEMVLESAGPSPAGTPRRSLSRASLSPLASSRVRSASQSTIDASSQPEGLLMVPLPVLTPSLGLNFEERGRSRSPSRARGHTT
jgi:hypothetical protein